VRVLNIFQKKEEKKGDVFEANGTKFWVGDYDIQNFTF